MNAPEPPMPGSPAGLPRWRKEFIVLSALVLTLIGPFMLRSTDTTAPISYDRRLVILSPHNERIRKEFGRAFAKRWKARSGEALYIDWRIPGGSSEIAMFMKSEFSGAFQYEWEHRLGRPWTPAVAGAFANPKITASASSTSSDNPVTAARRGFLDSSVGIGIDLLFGGGSYDFQQHAEAGYLVGQTPDGKHGLASVIASHPDWFTEAVMPEQLGGEPFRDPAERWIGVVLATFGIVYNRDVLHRLGVASEPAAWDDLAAPGLLGQVALSDPTKSGSVAKAFELMIQQQMHQAIAELSASRGENASAAELEAEGVRQGWEAGLRLIQRISANARYFTDSAAKIPLEVARGDAAAGMAIDSYGHATEEFVRRPDGRSRVGFKAPRGGTSLSVDSIAMLRGAPDPELATAFIEFVLSPEGQKLWAFRPGTPGGPAETALRRLPVRKDFYTDTNRRFMTDHDAHPYGRGEVFTYHPEWTGPAFPAIRFLIRVMCADSHRELKRAWRALVANDFPPPAVAAFHDLSRVSYEQAIGPIGQVLRARNRVREVRLARALGDVFRAQYERAYELAGGAADE